MAFQSWDSKSNIMLFDEDVYNNKTNSWIQISSKNGNQTPSSQKSFRKFKADHFSIKEDGTTGFITLSIKHQSPHVAKQWADLLVKQINFFYREKDKNEAEKAMNYLNSQIAKTDLTEIKQVIAGLLQQETQKLTLIEANEAYVFDYIDPPAVMERKVQPRRSTISILGTFIGFMLSVGLAFVRHLIFNRQPSQSY